MCYKSIRNIYVNRTFLKWMTAFTLMFARDQPIEPFLSINMKDGGTDGQTDGWKVEQRDSCVFVTAISCSCLNGFWVELSARSMPFYKQKYSRSLCHLNLDLIAEQCIFALSLYAVKCTLLTLKATCSVHLFFTMQ